MPAPKLRRSARWFAWGLVLVVGGALTWRAARDANARSAVLDPSFGGDPGRPWLVIGGFLVLVGVALLAVGVVRLTTHDPDSTQPPERPEPLDEP